MAPGVETGWEPALREIKKAKIPVILVDRGVKVDDDSLYATLICSDFVDEGRRAGEAVVKALSGKGNVVQLLGSPGCPGDRSPDGFEEVIAKNPGIKIIKSQTGDFKRSNGKEVMEAFLKSPEGGSINAVYAHNDDMALGAIQAIEAAGKKPGADILVFSIDGFATACRSRRREGKRHRRVQPASGLQRLRRGERGAGGQDAGEEDDPEGRHLRSGQREDRVPDRKY